MNFDCYSFLFVWFVESGNLIVPFDSSIILNQFILKGSLSFTGQLQVRQLLANAPNPTISVLDRTFSDMNFAKFLNCLLSNLISNQYFDFLFRIDAFCYWMHQNWNHCELSNRKFVLSYCQFQNQFDFCQYHWFGYTRTAQWYVCLIKCYDFIID